MPVLRKIDAPAAPRTNRHPSKYIGDELNPSWKPRAHNTSGASGKRHLKSTHGRFVAWDGEGVNTGRAITLDDGSIADEHILTLLACGDGQTSQHLYRDGERLTSMELLDFIVERAKQYGKLAIHVSFFFSYDASHILRDIPRGEVKKAYTSERTKLGHFCRYGPYLIKYIPRKQLYIAKLRDEARPYKQLPSGKYKIDKEWSVTIWDAHGFIQGSFQKALKEWNIGDDDQRAIIARGKSERDTFHTWSADDIIAYNDTENVLLVELMNKVRNAVRGLGLELSRWDGAGAIASAIFKKELPPHYIRDIELPPAVDEAGHFAFAGGRIECVQHGTYNDLVYRYDINSAYPSAMIRIPDLQNGEWRQWSGAPVYQDFALYHIEWRHAVAEDDQLPFYPFFHRDRRGYIYFPSFGENWIWGVELNAALDSGVPMTIDVSEGWEFIPNDDRRPFQFIEHYYQQRAEIKKRIKGGTAGDNDTGVSLAIKLGINSMYGKTAQKVGYDEATGTRPAYYNIAVAGWITAYTRAKLFRAAWDIRDHIIAFATDGIFATRPIEHITDSSTMGGWETEELRGIVMAQSGVYWTRDSKGEWSEHSRGFDRSDEPDTRRNRVLTAWAQDERVLPFPLKRFVAAKYASLTDARWAIRCSWLVENRELKLYDAGEKRQPIAIGKKALHKRLYRTLPSYSPQGTYGDIGLSAMCRTPWQAESLSDIAMIRDDETIIED